MEHSDHIPWPMTLSFLSYAFLNEFIFVFLLFTIVAKQVSSIQHSKESSHAFPVSLALALHTGNDAEKEMLALRIVCNKNQP